MASTASEESENAASRARLSVSVALAALILLLLLLLSLVVGLIIWREYQGTLALGQERAQNAAQTAAEHARWLIEANRSTLSRIDAALGEGTDWRTAPPHDANRFSGLVQAGMAIRVIDAAGVAVFTSEPVNPRVHVSDRDYFEALAGGEETYISRLLTDRPTGQRLFVVAKRLERDGAFAGVAAIAVPVQVLAPFWLSLGLGPGSSVGLINDEGWQVARLPVPEATLNFANHVLFTEHLPRASSGHYRLPASPVDAVARFVGYHRVPGLPLIAVVGISQDTVLSDLRRNILVLLALAIPLLVLLAIMSVLGIGWLRREERTRVELARALEQNRVLLQEIHHRVKNNLQVVTSLIRLQPGDLEAKTELIRRISAMAAMYEHIYRGDHFEGVDLAEHLPAIIHRLKESNVASATVDYDLDSLSVPNDMVLPLTLVASEVVGNAFKHAFPGEAQGRVTVSLRHQDDHATLTIADDGAGMDATRGSQGLGMKLLSAFSRQIGGEYSFDRPPAGGTVFTLCFPLAAHEEPPLASPSAAQAGSGAGLSHDAAADTAERSIGMA